MQRIFHGHFWTIAPWLRHQLRAPALTPSSPFSVHVEESPAGPVRLLGRIRHREGARAILVVIHGLGGTSESYYMIEAARRAEGAGLACLRLNLRGAGGDGDDLYHAGLFSDLHAAIASPELGRYERVLVLGYSLGGHIALRYAASGSLDARVRAVAAICPPLDLERSVTAIDQPGRWVYRRHVLSGLKEMYAAVASRRAVPLPVGEALAIRTIREWDRRIMTRRFGFQSPEAYYASESAAPRLRDLSVPSLLVATEADPMVPLDTVRPALEAYPPSPLLDIRWLRLGGHVGFPQTLSLGFGAAPGLESQVIHWLLRR
ncbi:alpha/beta fold hydrolase [Sorangium sp. So ce1036]|uniref:alpha/beta fold hydrolase n=1 Tax=Sorangium sp. So ce1036 TaxID=3133328 RepID=UPI003F058507